MPNHKWVRLATNYDRRGDYLTGEPLADSRTCAEVDAQWRQRRSHRQARPTSAFGQPRRGKRDGLPALQDRLDQLREGEANETANVAPGNALTLGRLLERSALPVASSSNHARPRAIALIRAGSHRELCNTAPINGLGDVLAEFDEPAAAPPFSARSSGGCRISRRR
jgi:hypothetical protein